MICKGKVYPLPAYGDHMIFKDFVELARSGSVTDDDGSAEWAIETRRTLIPLSCRVARCWGFNEPPFTHVLWFNK